MGAKPGSLGDAVAETAREDAYGWAVATAGLSRSEDHHLNLVGDSQAGILRVLDLLQPDHVVCTAGINHPLGAYASLGEWYEEHFNANVVGPMKLLEAFTRWPVGDMPLRHFVAISSNSAVIPRTGSGAYCASKAALSMSLRVAARNLSTDPGQQTVCYGYEPGLLAGTPMTTEVAARFSKATPLTRMRGAMVEHGLSVYGLAGHIVRNIAFGGPELNGVMLRLDAGEV